MNLGPPVKGSGEDTGGAWGGITGTLSDQTDLQAALDALMALAGGAALPTTANQNHAALTANLPLTSASAPFQKLTPNASDWIVYLPASYDARQISIKNASATYTFFVHNHTSGSWIATLTDGDNWVTFTQDSDDDDWGL